MARSDKIKFMPRLHWAEGTNTRPDNVRKLPQEWDDWNGTSSAKYNSYQANEGFKGLLDDWVTMYLHQVRDYIEMPRGGGHDGYYGSERLRFDLINCAWQRMEDPLPFPNLGVPQLQNGLPCARHTYNGVAYHEARDSMFMCSGITSGLPNTVRDMWELNSSGVWTRLADLPPSFNGNGYPEGHLVCRTVTGHMLFFNATALQAIDFNPANGQWSNPLSTTGTFPSAKASVYYDPDLDVVRFLDSDGQLYQFNCATNAFTKPTVSGAAPSGTALGVFAGFDHDPLNKRGVYWRGTTGGGTTIFTINRANHWSAHNVQTRVVGGIPANAKIPYWPPQTGSTPAVFGRFRWWRNRDCAIWVPSTDHNVFSARI